MAFDVTKVTLKGNKQLLDVTQQLHVFLDDFVLTITITSGHNLSQRKKEERARCLRDCR
jgi:hypothetical protein